MGATLLVIQHVPHERLGTFEGAFKDAGCALTYLNAYDAASAWPALERMSGLVVMGGPHSVYEQGRHPFFAKELALLRDALKAGLPILGVCLGAQLLAAALGADVTKSPQQEIGWYPLMRAGGADGSPRPASRARHSATRDAPASLHDPLFSIFEQTETVFQWHGDTFALPNGAVRLASSPLCREQAFRYRDNVYGLQFHVEVTEAMIRAWMQTPANREELASLRGVIDPLAIRRQSPQRIGRLQELGRHVGSAFCHLAMARRASPHARRG